MSAEVSWKVIRQSHALASAERLRFEPGPPAWSPSGDEVAFYWADETELQVWRFHVQSHKLSRVTAPPFAAAARQRTVMDRLFTDRPDWAPSGNFLAVVGKLGRDERALYLADLEGRLERLMGAPGSYRNPRWSPDGQRIVLVSYRDGKDDLWLVDPASRTSWQMTWDRYNNTDPVWSPDGRFIAYSSQRSNEDPLCSQICLVSLTDGSVMALPEHPKAHSRFPRWLDRDRLCFVSDRSGYDEIWEVDLRTGRMHPLTTPTGYDKGDFDLVPQGQHLVYTNGEGTNRHLLLLKLDDGTSRPLMQGDEVVLWPALSPLRSHIAFVRSGPYAPAEVGVIDFEGRMIAETKTASVPDEIGRVQHVRVPSSDGVTIDGLVYTPSLTRQRPGGAVLWIHGGPNGQHLNIWEPFFHHLTARGLTILAPNCRGSTGYGRAFMDANLQDWGGGDSRDWAACLDYLAHLDGIASDHLAVWGRSYGGYATLMALCLFADRLRAGVCQFGPAELVSLFQQTSVPHLLVRFMGLPYQRPDLYADRSPLAKLESLRAPLLLLQGEKDVAVPPAQALLVTQELERLGRPYEYVCYPEEGHGFDIEANALDAAARIEAFLGVHLPMGQDR